MAGIVNIIIVFGIIVLMINLTKKMPLAMFTGTVAAAVIYRLPPAEAAAAVGRALASPMTLMTVMSFYSITLLQRMMERRGQLNSAQDALVGIFNNRRLSAALASFFIGMLPSPGAVTICGAIMDRAAGDTLNAEEKCFVTSYYRHFPEAILPTFPQIVIAVQLVNGSMSAFLLLMFPLVLALAALGHFFYLRRMPKETGLPRSQHRGAYFGLLIKSFWPILLTIVLILALNFPVFLAVGIAGVLNIFINKFTLKELLPLMRTAFEMRLILTTICAMMFREVIILTGLIGTLPETLSGLPIPVFLAFFLIFFFGSIISGLQTIVIVALPLAFASVANAGMPLVVLLMSAGFAASQLAPTHLCLPIVSDYFKVPLGALIKRTIPIVSMFGLISIGYYLLLTLII